MATPNFLNTTPQSALVGALTNVATSMVVTTGDGTKFPTVEFNLRIRDSAGSKTPEVCRVTVVATDTFTITRGYDNTTAQAWSDGDIVEHVVIAEDMDQAWAAGGTAHTVSSTEPVSPSEGDVWVNPAAAAASVPNSTFSWNVVTDQSVSGSAFPWKGSSVIPHVNVSIGTIFFLGTVVSGGTYQGAVLTYSGTTIATITKTASVTAGSEDADATYATLMLTFSVPVELTAGTEYFIMFGRTDDTDTYALPIQYPTVRHRFPFGTMGVDGSLRVAKASPAVSDTVDLFTGGIVKMGVLWGIT